MGISLDLYDFFAHLIPGGFFLLAFFYAFQEAWLRSSAFSGMSTAQLIGLALLSYVLGYVIDPLGNRWYGLFRPKTTHFGLSQKAADDLSKIFPTIKIETRKMGWYVMLAYIKRHNLPMAQEIERFNVTHIMLRSVSLGTLVFSVVFAAKVVTNNPPVVYVFLSLLSMAASYLLMQEALKFRQWFYQSIYQSVLALKLTPEEIPVSYREKSL